MDEKLKICVYDDDDNITKTVEAEVIDLRFGTIRKLMELLNVEDINDTAELLRKVYAAWGQVTKVLAKVFPQMEENDWDNIKLSELMPVLVVILKTSFVQMLDIPNDSKN
jgi:hypothetical protein